MRVAYADPPYPGQSAKHYADHPDYEGEVDHGEMVLDVLGVFPVNPDCQPAPPVTEAGEGE